MKKKIILSIIYVVWGITLTLILSFGTDVSRKIVSKLKEIYAINVQRVTIENVELNYTEPYMINKGYYLSYTVSPQTSQDPGLKFESLTPDVFTVNEKGLIKSVDTDLEKLVGRLKITSKYDLTFQKEFTIYFEKKYPSVMSITINGDSYNTETQTGNVGNPIYLYCQFEDSYSAFSDTTIDYIFDEEYVEHISGTKFMLLKETDSTTITCVLKNGLEKSIDIKINPAFQEAEEIDSVRIMYKGNYTDVKDVVFTVSSHNKLCLFNEGERVYSDYSISFVNKGGYLSSLNKVCFTSAGERELLITLPNGFEYKTVVNVKNNLKLPVYTDINYIFADTINITEEVTEIIYYSFPSGATYKNLSFVYDKEFLSVSTKNGNQIIIQPLKPGHTTLVVAVDDGYDRVEQALNICINENPFAFQEIITQLPLLVAKVGGHMFLFFMLGIFAYFFISCFNFRSNLLNVILYLFSGLVFAILTEVIQMFLPGRNPAVKDVFIDMSGFLIGYIIIYLYLRHTEMTKIKIEWRRRKRLKKKNLLDLRTTKIKVSNKDVKLWPCQILDVPVKAVYYENAELLFAANCVSYVYKNFHDEYVNKYITLTGCPKNDSKDYTHKITQIIKNNNIKSLKIIRMDVNCCSKLEESIKTALYNSGKDLQLEVIILTVKGKVVENSSMI